MLLSGCRSVHSLRSLESLRDGDLLKESHEGGCVLYEKKEQVEAILKGES